MPYPDSIAYQVGTEVVEELAAHMPSQRVAFKLVRLGIRPAVLEQGPFPLAMVRVTEGPSEVAALGEPVQQRATLRVIILAVQQFQMNLDGNSGSEAERAGWNLVADIKSKLGTVWQTTTLLACGGWLFYTQGDVNVDEQGGFVESMLIYEGTYNWVPAGVT